MPTGYPDYRRNVDIASQSLSQLAIDIAAQSIGNLQVDLVAQTLAQMNIDIIAQTIGNLNIDVAAQTLGQIQNRWKFGAGALAFSSFNINPSENKLTINIEGTGIVYGVSIYVLGGGDSKDDVSKVTIDGTALEPPSLSTMNELRAGNSQNPIWRLNRYDEVLDLYSISRSMAMTFETSYQERYLYNGAGSATVDTFVLYSLI